MKTLSEILQDLTLSQCLAFRQLEWREMMGQGGGRKLAVDEIGEVSEHLFGQGGGQKLAVNTVGDVLIGQGGGRDRMVGDGAVLLLFPRRCWLDWCAELPQSILPVTKDIAGTRAAARGLSMYEREANARERDAWWMSHVSGMGG